MPKQKVAISNIRDFHNANISNHMVVAWKRPLYEDAVYYVDPDDNSAFGSMIRQIYKVSKNRTEKEIREIVAKAISGDNNAKDLLVLQFGRLALFIIRKYFSISRSERFHIYPDLLQEAGIALLKWAPKFNPTKKTNFSTFAYFVMKSAMLNFLNKISFSKFHYGVTKEMKQYLTYGECRALAKHYLGESDLDHSIENLPPRIQEKIKNYVHNRIYEEYDFIDDFETIEKILTVQGNRCLLYEMDYYYADEYEELLDFLHRIITRNHSEELFNRFIDYHGFTERGKQITDEDKRYRFKEIFGCTRCRMSILNRQILDYIIFNKEVYEELKAIRDKYYDLRKGYYERI